MLDALKSFFDRHAAPAGAAASPDVVTQRLQVAACALLLEMAHADGEFSAAECEHIHESLYETFVAYPLEFGLPA